MSQADLAKEVGTSQSHIARIETGEENITVNTLSRLITALRGRFRVSIPPQELHVPAAHSWWEASASLAGIRLKGLEYRRTPDEHEVRVTVGLPLKRADTLPASTGLFLDAEAS